MSSLVLRKIMQSLKAEEEHIDLERLKTRGSFKVMTREEKIREASRPLYLRRYE